MWILLGTVALACGNDVSRRVVGWTDDGLALVRIEHLNDEGELHALTLELLGPNSLESWVILEPEDEGDAKVPGARWTAAEAQLKAKGVAIDANIVPFSSSYDQTFRDWTRLPTGAEVRLTSRSYDEAMTQRVKLWARHDGQEGLVSILSENMNSQGGYNVESVYVHPESRSAAFVSGWSVAVVSGTEMDAGWKNPSDCEADTVNSVVGWTPSGGALVRTEATSAGEEPCRLALALVGTGNDQAFDILKPEDEGDAKIRARRWAEAEKTIQAAGVVIEADLKPSYGALGRAWNIVGHSMPLPGKPYALVVRFTGVRPEASSIHVTLFAKERKGDRLVEVGDLGTVPNRRYPYGIETMWTHPDGVSLVFLPSYGPQTFLHVDMAAVTTAWGSGD